MRWRLRCSWRVSAWRVQRVPTSRHWTPCDLQTFAEVFQKKTHVFQNSSPNRLTSVSHLGHLIGRILVPLVGSHWNMARKCTNGLKDLQSISKLWIIQHSFMFNECLAPRLIPESRQPTNLSGFRLSLRGLWLPDLQDTCNPTESSRRVSHFCFQPSELDPTRRP